jgi:hypothetical protein
VRIDRSDLADRPGDVHTPHHARSAPDGADAADINRGNAVSDDRPPDSFSVVTDSALRTERTAAYRADVDAVYRQYANDHGDTRADRLERETVTPEVRCIEAEAPEPRKVGPDDSVKAKGRLAEATDPKKGDVSEPPDGAASVVQGRSATADHDSYTRGRALRGDRSGECSVAPHAPAIVHDYYLPQGYTSSPALKRDPYHPDSVASRSRANQELYAATSRDRAAALGYTTRIPAQKVHFDSHDQEVFTNGRNYISPDVDSHNVTNGWKMFNRRGVRIGTYDSELNYVKE